MMSMWKSIRVVLRKELIDAARDRRALLPLLLLPLLGPLTIMLVFMQVVEQARPNDSTRLPVVGASHAPGLVAYLGKHNIEVVDAPKNPVEAVRSGQVPLVLIIKPKFGKALRANKSAELELIVDSARNDAVAATTRVRELITAHGAAIGKMRLLARGVSPTLAEPIVLYETELATPKKRAALFLEMLPMFVLLATFVGGMALALDSTAGERERGSLEPLLITPTDRYALVLGKWLAACLFAVVAALLTMGLMVVAVNQVPFERIGLSLELSAREVGWMLAAILPLALLFPAVQLLLASYARTVKEAQTYLSLGVLVPMLPALLTSLQVIDVKSWMLVVPVLGQQVLLTHQIQGEPFGLTGYLEAGLAAFVLGLLCVRAAAALFKRERIIFGRS
jgi:sodium transport system permease protein